jgi:dephospho-CoA kinase
MIVLGLTGSIGMGKSTAARMLVQMGCPVHDSDKVAREALDPNGEAFEDTALMFPEVWNKKKHVIKRDVLAEIIFKDIAAKEKLENLIHPIVRASQKKFIQKQKKLGRNIVALDIPLLFETGAQNRVDYTIVVSAPLHIQRQRVLSRTSMNEEKFQAILNHQMSDIEKCKQADYVVPTGMGMALTYRTLSEILKDVRRK